MNAVFISKIKINFQLQASNRMFKVSNRNSITRCEICSKLTIKTPERRLCRRSGVFFVNFEHISQLVLVFLLGGPKKRGPKIRLSITKTKGKF